MTSEPRKDPREERTPRPADERKPQPKPYPVDDPGIADPDGPGSEPDYLPPTPEPVRFRSLGAL